MRRIDNWPKALSAYFRSMEKVPFKFGENDCGLFACGAVQAITGVDLAADLRGTYSDAEGEKQVLLEIAAKAGLQSIDVKKAQRGDVALHIGKNGPSVMVVDGTHCIGPGENGFVIVPMSECSEAWRIG